MGNCHLTLANYWLGKVDTLDEEESDTKTELKEEETKAAEQLKKGKTEIQIFGVYAYSHRVLTHHSKTRY
jgi:hypothetical protein